MKLKSPKSIAKSEARRQVKKATGVSRPKRAVENAVEDAVEDVTGLQRPKKAVRKAVRKKTGVRVPNVVKW